MKPILRCWLIALWFFLCAGTSYAQTDPLNTWTQTWAGNPLIPSIASVSYGNGRFVGIGSSGVRTLSYDAVNWTTYVSAPIIDGGGIPGSTTTSNGISTTTGFIPGRTPGIVYAAGMFIEFGASGIDKADYILKSTNGLTWQSIYTSNFSNAPIYTVAAAYGNNTWVFIRNHTQTSFSYEIVSASVTSSNWNWSNLNTGFSVNDLTYGNGVFAICATINYFDPQTFQDLNYNMILSSPDGMNWQFVSAPLDATASFSGMTYGNGLFVATGYDPFLGGIALTSSNLVDWISTGIFQPTNSVLHFDDLEIAIPANFRKISFAGNQFVTSLEYYYFDFANVISTTFTSSDGVNWMTNSWPSGVNTFTFGQGTFVAAGQNIYQSGIFTNDIPEPTILGISTYPGVTINGTAGAVYQIQTSTNLNDWQTLTNFALPYSPYIWVDTGSTVSGQKFYRSIQLQ
ncbi:MAG: hypothetical protein WDN00_17925 [Limisphaerales bacterium]